MVSGLYGGGVGPGPKVHKVGRSLHTLGHVGELVLAHGLEGGSLELALELGWDSEEVDSEGEDANEACEDGEELCGGHGCNWIFL